MPLIPSFKSVFLSPCPCAAAIRAIENAWENTEGRGDMFYEVWGLAGEHRVHEVQGFPELVTICD